MYYIMFNILQISRYNCFDFVDFIDWAIITLPNPVSNKIIPFIVAENVDQIIDSKCGFAGWGSKLHGTVLSQMGKVSPFPILGNNFDECLEMSNGYYNHVYWKE